MKSDSIPFNAFIFTLLVVATISSALTYYIGLNFITEKEKIITQEKIPSYIQNTYNKYSLTVNDKQSWDNFLDVYLKENTKYVLPNYISKDIKKAGFDARSLDKKMWQNYLTSLVEKNIAKNYMKNNLLLKSALSGEVDLNNIKKLIENGYDINLPNENGENYIQLLVQNWKNEDDIEDIKKLVEDYGADIGTLSNIDVKKGGFTGQKDILNYAMDNKNIFVKVKIINYLNSKGVRIENHPEKYIDLVYTNGNKYRKEIIDNIDMNAKIDKNQDAFTFLLPNLSNEEITKVLNSGYDVTKIKSLPYMAAMNKQISEENIKKLNFDNIKISNNKSLSPIQKRIIKKLYEKNKKQIKN